MEGFKKRRLLLLAISLAFFSVISLLMSCLRPAPAKHATEVAEISGPAFTVRISEFPEEHGGFVPGAYYRFESLPNDSKNWATVMEFRHDDPVPVPRENVKFLTPKSAFVYMGWKYAVTIDGGKRWHVWDAQKDLAGWRCCNYGLIKEVVLEENGGGRMILQPIQDRPGEVPELVTSDFGVHWSPRKGHD